jgi:hypothetical protein
MARMLGARINHIPNELEAMAERLSRVSTGGFAEWHQRDAIPRSIGFVRALTGRYHYEEVSLLISAEVVSEAMKRGPDLSFDPAVLAAHLVTNYSCLSSPSQCTLDLEC